MLLIAICTTGLKLEDMIGLGRVYQELLKVFSNRPEGIMHRKVENYGFESTRHFNKCVIAIALPCEL